MAGGGGGGGGGGGDRVLVYRPLLLKQHMQASELICTESVSHALPVSQFILWASHSEPTTKVEKFGYYMSRSTHNGVNAYLP